MNTMMKSTAIKSGLRKSFQDGSSKMARRKCYGYDSSPDGTLTINPDEAQVVVWIFEQYRAGKSLGKIAAGLEKQGILSPTGKPKWNREAIDKLLSNEKYTAVCCYKRPSVPAFLKLKMMASWIGISTPTAMRSLFLISCLRMYSEKSSTAPNLLIRGFS